MKDLINKLTGKKGSLTNASGKPPAQKQELQDFLQKLATMPKSTGKEARLVFALDATASRQATWDQASRLQKEMFISTQSLGGLQVQLCYFQGLAGLYKTSWHNNSDKLLSLMSGIHCQAGMTQIQRLLRHIIAENAKHKINSVIFIGDAMEENIDILCQLAGELGLLNVPLFIFQEREDPAARQAFAQMARLSGGAYCHFDSSSADQLRDLLKAVAIYASGGLRALQDFSKNSHQSVKLLGQQLK
jgi:hypothetical protein